MINSIKHLYPSAIPLVDFVLQDNSDGNGPFIAMWDEVKLGPKPSKADLDAVSVAAEQARVGRVESSKAEVNLTKLRADIFPDVLAFLATIGGVPKVIKDASILAATEKLKIK